MTKFQKIMSVIGLGFLVVIAVFFYWTQYRPAKIKHDCSWVKIHTDVVPERIGMTEKEMQAKGLLKTCPTLAPNYPGLLGSIDRARCLIDNQDILKRYRPQKYVPAKDWYEKATKDQFNFCLHDKGL